MHAAKTAAGAGAGKGQQHCRDGSSCGERPRGRHRTCCCGASAPSSAGPSWTPPGPRNEGGRRPRGARCGQEGAGGLGRPSKVGEGTASGQPRSLQGQGAFPSPMPSLPLSFPHPPPPHLYFSTMAMLASASWLPLYSSAKLRPVAFSASGEVTSSILHQPKPTGWSGQREKTGQGPMDEGTHTGSAPEPQARHLAHG